MHKIHKRGKEYMHAVEESFKSLLAIVGHLKEFAEEKADMFSQLNSVMRRLEDAVQGQSTAVTGLVLGEQRVESCKLS